MDLDALTAMVKIYSMNTVMAENKYFPTFGGNTINVICHVKPIGIHYENRLLVTDQSC